MSDANATQAVDAGRRLTRGDWAVLVGLCALLDLPIVFSDRTLVAHETIHCCNVREMLQAREWVVPTCGGFPWLERPPLPQWMTAAVVASGGDWDAAWSYRLAAALASLGCVALTAWMAAVGFGRAIGLLSGAMTATMYEFSRYAVGTESDIFLTLVTTSAIALFVRIEFVEDHRTDRRGFFGGRPWASAAFFVVLGSTNIAKGLFFGTLHVLMPVGAFLLFAGDRSRMRRYVWFWGWLAFVAVSAAWPAAMAVRYPAVMEIWIRDYPGRLSGGYVGEPVWYYALHLPTALLPWTAVAAAGLVATRREASAHRDGLPRFVWCWAVLPPLVLSIPQGKHHHYLLECLPAWGMLAALGCVRLRDWWRAFTDRRWTLAIPAAIATGGVAAVLLLQSKIRGGPAAPVVLASACVVAVFGAWFASRMRNGWAGAAVLLGGAVAGLLASDAYRTTHFDAYADDMVFVERVKAAVGEGEAIRVIADDHPLNPSWLLFHLGRRAVLEYDCTFALRAVEGVPMHIVAHEYDSWSFRKLGRLEVVARSRQSHHQLGPEDRLTLFRLTPGPAADRSGVRADDIPPGRSRAKPQATPRLHPVGEAGAAGRSDN